MTKRVDDLEILENKRLTDDLFVIELKSSGPVGDFRPGQFVQAKVDGSANTFLRRPVSIYDVDNKNNTFRLLIQKIGQGTGKLSELRSGDLVNLIYPLGNSFSDPTGDERILLTGGGVGIAPLLFLGKHLQSIGYRPEYLLGFRSDARIPDLHEFRSVGEVALTTEDGSAGEKGYVTDHSVLTAERFDRIYCCGPDSMMKAVAAYCKKNGIFCEVSLENLMACGFGVCLCCIAETVRGNLCTCTEGPVFNINDLKW